MNQQALTLYAVRRSGVFKWLENIYVVFNFSRYFAEDRIAYDTLDVVFNN